MSSTANKERVRKRKRAKTKLDPKRERTFRLLAACLPIVLVLLIEAGLRIFNYQGNLDLFVTAPGEYSQYLRCNPNVARRYFFMQSTVPDPPNDFFLKEKPPNAYRIFVMGGSTTAGYPYGNNLMFSRILHERLEDAFPTRHIEVVNTAMTAINSYTLLDLTDEILQHEADAVLIYAGHNEYYGALGVGSNESLGRFPGFVKLYLKLQRYKTFLLVRNTIGAVRNWLDKTFRGGTVDDPNATLMERLVGEQIIPYKSSLYDFGKRQFESNLRDILEKAKQSDVPVMISELVSNVRDHKPFVSVESDTWPQAESEYLRARKLEQAGQFDLARDAYFKAKDLDALRFRATEEFNEIIRTVGSEFEVPVVPMLSYFEKASPNGIIGNNLMLEHLHPNADGYFLMAEAFFDTMREVEFIEPDWRVHRPAISYRQTWGYTELDKAYADIRVRILKGNWPFKPKSTPNRALIDYQPHSLPESLAVKIWLEKGYNLERGHLELAEHYEKRGEFQNAFEEYKALIYITPLNSSPYLRASRALIKSKRLRRALPYLLASLKLEDTAYANKWLGQIYLNDGKTKEALPYLEKAAKMTPNDVQLLYNLSGAYALNQQFELAKKTLKALDNLNPNFPGAADLRKQLEQL